MKNILVPCDFSQPAINAFRFALDIAGQSAGTVHLLHVIELPVMYDSVMMPALNFEVNYLKELKDNAEKSFQKNIKNYNLEGVKVHTEVVYGSVFTKILETIPAKEIDLVVMGSQGANGFKELFVGSNAERIVRTSPVPVLVMKEYYKGSIKNIVFPNSLELDQQEDFVMKVKALQHFFKAHLHIVYINTPINFQSDIVNINRLNAFVKRFMIKDYTLHIFNHTNEEDGIIEFSKSINGNIIAMATHGRTGVSHVLNGSLAEDVVNHAQGLIWTCSLKNEMAEA